MRSNRSFPITLSIDGEALRFFVQRNLAALLGLGLISVAAAVAASLATWAVHDPSLSNATDGTADNALGFPGAAIADLAMQFLGLSAIALLLPPVVWAWQLVFGHPCGFSRRSAAAWIGGTVLVAGAIATLPPPAGWPLPTGLGGVVGDIVLVLPIVFLGASPSGFLAGILGTVFAILAYFLLRQTLVHPGHVRAAVKRQPEADPDEDAPSRLILILGWLGHFTLLTFALMRRVGGAVARLYDRVAVADDDDGLPARQAGRRIEPSLRGTPVYADDDADERADFDADDFDPEDYDDGEDEAEEVSSSRVIAPMAKPKPGRRIVREAQRSLLGSDGFELPPLHLLAEPKAADRKKNQVSADALEQNARLLEGVLDDFGVRGEIFNVRPGPVVTLYELEPAPGIKSSRVIGLADDIARSMSAIAARVAVIPGKNAIGIELPNARRETVYLREILASEDFEKTKTRLALCLGKTIGGEAVIADLARMPHLLIAGTTGSGKSVAVNAMILSLLYRLEPHECRMIMIDPKMLELSIYDGIPHLLTPVVTDPKKAVVALKWTVREMEDRYRKMSKLGVRNIDGYNNRIAQAESKRERLTRTVQTGFDRETGEAIYEQEELVLERMPYIVVIIDEMADLMMVAGKDIEGAVQRLAQMARAAGIHVVMATQRPSVDVITGTIKANFPTRISFQVTSKIDSRTILGEQGAEQLLGQGDMLYMAGGGRIVRVHGPFVDDHEVEQVVAHLKDQGIPEYLEAITEEDEGDNAAAGFGGDDAGDPNDPYQQAIEVVLRDKKASTSYIQRRLGIGYNRAASIIERMEDEGIVGPADHAGRREILVGEEEMERL